MKIGDLYEGLEQAVYEAVDRFVGVGGNVKWGVTHKGRLQAVFLEGGEQRRLGDLVCEVNTLLQQGGVVERSCKGVPHKVLADAFLLKYG